MKPLLALAASAAGLFAVATAAFMVVDEQRAPALLELSQAGSGPSAAFACFDQDDAREASAAFAGPTLGADLQVEGFREHWGAAQRLVHLKRCAEVSPGVPHRIIRQEAGFAEVEFSLQRGPLRLWAVSQDAARL